MNLSERMQMLLMIHMNSEKYNAVVRDIDKIQQELGRDGVINEFVDPLKGIRGRNYQLFMNIVPEMRNMLLHITEVNVRSRMVRGRKQLEQILTVRAMD